MRRVVIAVSNSGEAGELKSTVLAVKNNGGKIIGVSGNPDNWLAHESDVLYVRCHPGGKPGSFGITKNKGRFLC